MIREEDRNCDGIAISMDERACVLKRMLRPAIRSRTGRFCSHANTVTFVKVNSYPLVFRSGEKWLLYEDRFLYLSLFAARFNLLALWLMISGDLSDAVLESSGDISNVDRDTTHRASEWATKISFILSYVSRFSSTQTRL